MHASNPNSPIDDEEHFEFVDYTAASQWERFITTVEEVLNGWGVNDGQLGIFDDSKLPPLGDEPSTKTIGGIDPFVKREIIILDDNSYTLSYHYHPIKRWNEFTISRSSSASSSTSELPPPPTTTTLFPPNPDPFLPSSEFLPITLPNTSMDSTSISLNKIHRWTGLTHILVLTPTDIFSTGTISKSTNLDLNTTKMLLSSFAIAFHNTKCKLPVYVPTGQVANSLYAGYMCLFNKYVKNVIDAGEVEIRFNTTYVRDVPSRFSHLTGLTEFFTEKMDLNQIPIDQVDVPELDKMPHLGIAVAGLFTYKLQNLGDRDWKNIDDNEFPSTPLSELNEDIFKGFEGQNGGMFGNGVLKDSSGFSQTSVTSASILPFGPSNDPLQSLSLTAFFPSAPRDSYLDNDVYSEMDAVRAPIWILGCNFHPEKQEKPILSSILNNAISSLNIDCGNELAEKSNFKGKFRSKVFRKSDIPGTFKSDDSAYDSVRFARSNGGIVDMDDVDIDHILRGLFNPLSNKVFPNNAERINTLSGIPLLSASSLGLYFRDVRTVPYKSFLWNLIEYLLETISSSSDSFLGFLKILWNEILREIRLHWERYEPLPDVNIYMSENENVSSDVIQNGFLSIDDNKVKNSTVEKTNPRIGIDMRFNIIHQKLCMINCCVTRLRQDQKYNPYLSTSPKNRLSSNNSLGSSDSMSNNKISKNSLMEQKQTTIDPLVRLFDHITGEDIPENSVILVPPVNSSGAGDSEISTLDEKSNHINSASSNYVPMPSVGESGEEFFDAIEEATSTPLGIPSKKNSNRQHRRSPSSLSHIHSNSPTTSLFSDHSDQNPHASSLSDSFIQLNYSSSMDSNQEFEFTGQSSASKLSLNDDGADKEVKDENEREGHLYHFNNLKLLKTGEPLLVPEIQDTGFMTEDMLREQEEIFEKLGSSEDATKIRAELQSAQLKSDMQAFKAANPHAILEDFIRWHSPRDWISDESGDPNKGTLSPRMKEKGNLWQELWKSSKRIPVRRQKPLFKYACEAEKALHYLEQLSVRDLFKELLPTIFLIAYDTLVSQSVSKNIKPVTSGLAALAQELLDFPWSEIGSKNIVCDGLIQSFSQNEMLIGKSISLLRKLPKQYDLVERLLGIPETQVLDGKERESVYELFASGAPLNDSFPQPTTREFVLQTTCLRPTPVPTRMYVSLDNSGMRIVDMVGKDTIFM
ncbi:Rab3 GTPase-activating protein catalytic subunit-domain-containing protein [Glomus cerebriforme]|uniref:Rab3 GTPase-activating protein catalytic subunit n=1 Tax=Glomus cerebriforme TaxID=658196 RepID=A0A397SPN2_9GLOM|nr:Rab3 GTPase-activating protein catalytic subunit-domain-containing protein [Glomus cerebriforme]